MPRFRRSSFRHGKRTSQLSRELRRLLERGSGQPMCLSINDRSRSDVAQLPNHGRQRARTNWIGPPTNSASDCNSSSKFSASALPCSKAFSSSKLRFPRCSDYGPAGCYLSPPTVTPPVAPCAPTKCPLRKKPVGNEHKGESRVSVMHDRSSCALYSFHRRT